MRVSVIAKDCIAILVLILVLFWLGPLVYKEKTLFTLGIGLILFVILVKKPELSLAILFNGMLIYFYVIYKLGIDGNRLLTGSLYATLVFSPFFGAILLGVKKRFPPKPSLVDVLFVSLFLWIFLSYFIFYTGTKATYIKLAYAPLMVIMPYAITRLLLTEVRIRRFFNYCVYLSIIIAFFSFYELISNPALNKVERFSIDITKDGWSNHIVFGVTFAVTLLIVFISACEKNKNKFKSLILIIPFAYLLVRSGSRGALLSFILTIVFYFIFMLKGIKRGFYLTILFVIVILIFYRFTPQFTTDRYKNSFEYENMPWTQSTVAQRIIMWKNAVEDFKRHPILGVGIGNSGKDIGVGIPHNIIFEVASELGIIGLFMFLSMCYLTIKRAFKFIKNERNDNLSILTKLALLLFVYNLTMAMFSGYITNQVMFFISMGIIMSLVELKQKKNAPLKIGIKV